MLRCNVTSDKRGPEFDTSPCLAKLRCFALLGSAIRFLIIMFVFAFILHEAG